MQIWGCGWSWNYGHCLTLIHGTVEKTAVQKEIRAKLTCMNKERHEALREKKREGEVQLLIFQFQGPGPNDNGQYFLVKE